MKTLWSTYSVFAGGFHNFAETDAHTLPLIALFRAQTLLQDGDDFRKDLLSQFPYQIPQSTSCDLAKDKIHHWRTYTRTDKFIFTFVYIFERQW